MKKLINLLILSVLCSLFCYADEVTNGEYGTQSNGALAVIGQTTLDHLFVRGDYDDNGTMMTYDNVVSFKSGEVQTVWLWFDDDEIYLNERVQALPPTLIANGEDPYNEITYYSFQCGVYLPDGVKIVRYEDENGNNTYYSRGDRMPSSADFMFNERVGVTKVIDGINYHVYSLMVSNQQLNGTHFSSRNARMYRERGALKKDDAPLICIFLKNTNQDVAEGRLSDMIIANQEFGFIEAFTVTPQWEPNDYRYIYGEGGNNVAPRFQYYNRVALYGSLGMENTALRGDVNGNGEVDISDVTLLIDVILGKNVTYDANAADCNIENGNGSIDINDVTALINHVLNGNW